MTEKQYDQLVRELSPSSPAWKDCIWAFCVGGGICVLGQAPSKVIYDVKIPADRKPTRDTLFDDIEMMKLRNELIRYINRDVASHIE